MIDLRFSRYIGDMSIDLEGKPEEIIQVLKYLDGVDNKDGEMDDTKEIRHLLSKRVAEDD